MGRFGRVGARGGGDATVRFDKETTSPWTASSLNPDKRFAAESPLRPQPVRPTTPPVDTADDWDSLLAATPHVSNYSEVLRARLATLGRVLLEANLITNLTALRDPAGVAMQHFADSLAVAAVVFASGSGLGSGSVAAAPVRAADMGTGPGFPLLPLAMVGPDVAWTGIEATGKKCAFIRSAAVALDLPNVAVVHARAEDAGRDPALRESFDVVTARAVGPTASLVEVGLPLLKIGGRLILMKTESALAEIDALTATIRSMGGITREPLTYRLPGDRQGRVALVIEKIRGSGTKWPRGNGLPFQKPMGA